MEINIVFIKSKKGFNRKEGQKIENIVRKTAKQAAKILNLAKNYLINFIVYPFDKNYVGGLTQAEDFIQISIPRKKKLNEEELKSTIYHEMHHIKRGFFGYTKKKISLLEALFSEGLATVFALKQAPKYTPKWSRYTKSFIKKWFYQVKKEKFNTNYSHDEWFFGARGKPFQLGYKIGTYLVNRIKKNHPELTTTKLVKKKAKILLKLSKICKLKEGK